MNWLHTWENVSYVHPHVSSYKLMCCLWWIWFSQSLQKVAASSIFVKTNIREVHSQCRVYVLAYYYTHSNNMWRKHKTTLCITTNTAPVCNHWTAKYINIDTDISLEHYKVGRKSFSRSYAATYIQYFNSL